MTMKSGAFCRGLIVAIAIGQVVCIPAVMAKFYDIMTYENCKHMEGSAARLSDVKVSGKPNAIELSATMDVEQELEPPVHLTMSVKRCNLQQEDCESYEQISMEDICTKIKNNLVMQKYMEVFTPPLSCPLKKGHYVAEKKELRLQMLEMFPVENAFWQIELRFLDKQNRTMQCDFVELTVTNKE